MNVLHAEMIDAVLPSLANEDEKMLELLTVSLRRVLLKEYRDAEPRDLSHVLTSGAVTHVRDWLAGSLAQGAAWLDRVDDKGRPLKLMKAGTLSVLMREADKWMAKELSKFGRKGLDGSEEALWMDLEDGWRIVKLLTPTALDRESSRMQHCIGLGTYDHTLANERFELLSLRDPHGKPHATVLVEGGSINEVSGKQNDFPAIKYLKKLVPLLLKYGDGVYLDGSYGFVLDRHGELHDYSDLPEVLEVDGNLYLLNSDRDGPYRLPRTIRANGFLSIDGDIFEGDIDEIEATHANLSGMRLSRLPTLKGVKSLDLSNTTLTELPQGLEIEDHLILKSTPMLALPAGLKVGGLLDTLCTDIAEIPDDAEAGRIQIGDSAVRRFPGNRRYASVAAARSSLDNLPSGLVVDGTIDISETSVGAIPDDLIAEKLVAERCRLRMGASLMGVEAMDFTASTIRFSSRDFECLGSISLRAVHVNMDGVRLVSGGEMNLMATHFDSMRLPSLMRAPRINLCRSMARVLPEIDTEIETDVLVLSDAPVVLGPNVTINSKIVIAGGHLKEYVFDPDDALHYLAHRDHYSSLDHAREFYNCEVLDAKYHYCEPRMPIST